MHAIVGDPAADAYLDRLLARVRAILGDRLVGVYLVNSGARADYLRGRSDLDVAVAVDGLLDEETKRGLAAALLHRALPCPAPRLELVVYRREVLARPADGVAFELNLNTGSAIKDRVTVDPADEPAHWFVLDLAAAVERAATIAGPPLGSIAGAVPDRAVLEALQASQAWHAAHDTLAPNRVLNDCRAWRWTALRRWASKAEAAAWAIAAGGDRELIERALALRRGEAVGPLPRDRVERFAARVAREVERAAPRVL